MICFSGCSNQSLNGKPINSLLDRSIKQLDQDQLDFNKIEAIILTIESQPIAAIRPRSVEPYTTEQVLLGEHGKWECQIAEWELLYIATNNALQSACNEYWTAIEDRLTPQSPKRQDLIAIPDLQYIEIGWGTSDNNLMIEQDENSPDYYEWRYYTSSGQVCSGQVTFVLKH